MKWTCDVTNGYTSRKRVMCNEAFFASVVHLVLVSDNGSDGCGGCYYGMFFFYENCLRTFIPSIYVKA